MRIGELGRRVGVSTRTLRHYESLGLLPARRDTRGYRAELDAQLHAALLARAPEPRCALDLPEDPR